MISNCDWACNDFDFAGFREEVIANQNDSHIVFVRIQGWFTAFCMFKRLGLQIGICALPTKRNFGTTGGGAGQRGIPLCNLTSSSTKIQPYSTN